MSEREIGDCGWCGSEGVPVKTYRINTLHGPQDAVRCDLCAQCSTGYAHDGDSIIQAVHRAAHTILKKLSVG